MMNISRSEILNEKLSVTDGFAMAEYFGVKTKERKPKMRITSFPCKFPTLQKCKEQIIR
jgi:hypothetical protein